LRFFRDYGIPFVPLTLKLSGDRTEVAARANNNGLFDLVIGDPPVALASERSERPVVEHTDLRPAQQKVVEFAAADGIADDGRIRGFDGRLTDHPRSEPGDLLENETGSPVLIGFEIDGAKHPWRHPTTAHLVARETCAIQDDDVPSCKTKRARTARARGSAADNPRVTASHRLEGLLPRTFPLS